MREFSEAEAAVLDMLAKASDPWVRRSLADLVGGKPIVDTLEAEGLIQPWSTMVVDEKHEVTRKDKDTKRSRRIGWRPTRARRMAFVALTGLGQSVMSRDVFERGDAGRLYQGPRRRSEAGAWVLPDTPIKSSRRNAVDLCPDQLPDQPERTAKGKRAG